MPLYPSISGLLNCRKHLDSTFHYSQGSTSTSHGIVLGISDSSLLTSQMIEDHDSATSRTLTSTGSLDLKDLMR